MKKWFIGLWRALFPKGVWLAFHYDFSGFAFFEEEIEARRHAQEQGMLVKFIKFGEDVPQAVAITTEP